MIASKLHLLSCCAMAALLVACKPAPDASQPAQSASTAAVAPASAPVAPASAPVIGADGVAMDAAKLVHAWVEAGAGLHALSVSCGRLDKAKLAQGRARMKEGLVGEGAGKLSVADFEALYQAAYDTTAARIVKEPAKAKLGCAQLEDIEGKAREASKRTGLPAPQ